MRKIIYLTLLVLAGIVIYISGTDNGQTHAIGAPAFTSGSPHDGGNCANGGCHDTYPVKLAPTGWITSNIPAGGYIPGTTYTITCRTVSTISGQNSNFGFEISPQIPATGAIEGTLANIKTSGTGSTKIISSGSSQWVTHTATSFRAIDSTTWSFKWTAPKPGIGAVNFYACFNCGSADNRSTAQIYSDSVHYAEDSITGMAQIQSPLVSLAVYPNPITTDFSVQYSISGNSRIAINLYTIEGKLALALQNETEKDAGTYTLPITIPQNISKGIYLLQFVENGIATYKRVVIE